MKITQIEAPQQLRLAWLAIGTTGKAYETDTDCHIIVSREQGRWHMSISHNERYPSWDEIHEARYELLPEERTFAMILPPKSEYVNLHHNCFHLWEI
jgi:hypothetical protein